MNTAWPALVTGTIIPDPRAIAKLVDPVRREKHYIDTLKWMARANTGIETVVFCENSSADLSSLRHCRQLFLQNHKVLDIEKVPMLHDRDFLGKGWGEGMIIRWAINHLSTFGRHQSFIKITGRYRILNLNRINLIIQQGVKQNPQIKFVCQEYTEDPAPYVPTWLFWSDREFFLRHLADAYEEVNDEQGIYLEHAIAKRLCALKDRFEIRALPIPVIVRGIYGWDEKPIMSLPEILMRRTHQALTRAPSLKDLNEAV